MKRRAWFLFLFLATASLFAQNGASLPLFFAPDPATVALGDLPRPLDPQTLLRAALYFSGASAATIDAAAARVWAAVDELRTEFERPSSASAGAAAPAGDRILQFLHGRFLTRYEERQSKIDVLLETGRYNCVSSAILYFVVARSFGLDVGVDHTTDHVFCTVRDPANPGAGAVDVETTNLYGYNPGQRREFRDSFGNMTGYTYVPPTARARRTMTSGEGLVAMILLNDAAELEAARRYAEALPFALNAWRFVRDGETRARCVTAVSNYASLLNNRALYAEGLDFLRRMAEAYGDAPELAAVWESLAQNIAGTQIDAGDFAAARELVAVQSAAGHMGAAVRDRLLAGAADAEAYRAVHTLPFDEAVAYVVRTLAARSLDATRGRDFLVWLYGTRAEAMSRAEGWLAAADFLEAARPVVDTAELRRARDNFRYNYAVDVHNRFVPLARERRYEEALVLLDAALAELPDARILIQDRDSIRRAMEAR